MRRRGAAARFARSALLAAGTVLGAGWLAPAAAQETLTYTVLLSGGRIEPARLEVPAGKRIKFIVRNAGPGPVEFENLELRVEKVLAPGASSFVVMAPLRPGSYRFIDEFHPETGRMDVVAK